MEIIKKIFIILIVAGIIVIGIFNFNNGEFWNISICDCLTLIVAVVIAYYFTKSDNKITKKREIIESILDKIQFQINHPEYYKLKETDEKDLYMMKRAINNKIALLEKNEKGIKISAEIKYIKDKFNDYRSLIDEHITDKDYLAKSEKELRKMLMLIDDKIDEIKLKLYEL